MKKMLSGLNIAVLLSCLFSTGAFASSDFTAIDAVAITPTLSVKNGNQDSATRTGTENWEQPQGGFFVVPGVIIALAALILFWKRD
jgi:hypothetical protein